MMAMLAPNTAALDTPKVEGEAMSLPKQVCMISPAKDNPAPEATAASALGSLILCTILMVEVDPFPNKARKDSPIERLELPKVKEKKRKRRRSKELAKKKNSDFFAPLFPLVSIFRSSTGES